MKRHIEITGLSWKYDLYFINNIVWFCSNKNDFTPLRGTTNDIVFRVFCTYKEGLKNGIVIIY